MRAVSAPVPILTTSTFRHATRPKSVLVPYSAQQMFDLVDDVERYPRVPALVRRQRGAGERGRRQDGAHRHRLPRRDARTSRPTTSTSRGESIAIALKDGPFRALHGKWTFRALAPRRVQGRVHAGLRIQDDVLEAVVGPVFNHIANTFIDAFVRRAEAHATRNERQRSRSPWPTRRRASRRSCRSTLPAGATVADAVAASGLCARFALPDERRAMRSTASAPRPETPLADGDRVELTRPLVADAKADSAGARGRASRCPRPRKRQAACRHGEGDPGFDSAYKFVHNRPDAPACRSVVLYARSFSLLAAVARSACGTAHAGRARERSRRQGVDRAPRTSRSMRSA